MPETSYSGTTAEMAVELLNSYRLVVRDRDKIIRAAYAAGLTRHAIHVHSGVARTTINRALDTSDA